MKTLQSLKPDLYVFFITISFYLFLWLVNPNNKLIVVAAIGLFLIYQLRLKNFHFSLLLTFLAYSIIFTGKSYPVQLLPPGVFPEEIFPQGYFISLVITPSHLIAGGMLMVTIRHIFLKGKMALQQVSRVDLLLMLFFFWTFLSDTIFSQRPNLSIGLNLLSLSSLVLYFYIKIIDKNQKIFLPTIIGLIASLVMFESLVVFRQFVAKAPLSKNLEYQINIEYFGKAPDEQEFAFRPVGTFAHANFLGIWTASMLIFLLAVFYQKRANYIAITLTTGFMALIMTLSRSAWLGFFSGALFILFILERLKNKRFPRAILKKGLLVMFPVVLLGVVFLVIPRLEKSFYSFGPDYGGGYFRKIQIQDSLAIISQNPFFGVGKAMGVFEGLSLNLETVAASIPLAVHNWYLQLALEHGLPALMIFIFLLGLSTRNFFINFTKIRFLSLSSFIHLGLIGAIFALLAAAFFQPYINKTFIFFALGLMNSGIMEKEKYA